MLKFQSGEEHQRILVLNYNTIVLQSVGFLNYMVENLGETHAFMGGSDYELMIDVLRYADRNTAKLIDPKLEEKFYLTFLKGKYKEIMNISTLGSMQGYLSILKTQNFVNDIHIASPVEMDSLGFDIVFGDISTPVFDIFDADAIVKYINKEKMTCLFLHDIELLKKVIDHPEMDSEQFTYVLSKIGYNYQLPMNPDDPPLLKYPEIYEEAKEKRFLFGIVDLIYPGQGEDDLPTI